MRSLFLVLFLFGFSVNVYSNSPSYAVDVGGSWALSSDKPGLLPAFEHNYSLKDNWTWDDNKPYFCGDKVCWKSLEGTVTARWGAANDDLTCENGSIWDPITQSCPPNENCPDLQGQDAPFPQGPVPDDGQSLGSSRLSCDISNKCEVLSGYRASGGSMIKDSFYTGKDCVGNPEDYADCSYYGSCDGGTPPEPEDLEDPWEGCTKPYVDSAFVCREDTDGDGKPNPDAPYDDKAICDHDSSGKFSCRLGSFDKDEPTDPIEPTEPDGDVSHGGNIPDASGDPATIQPVDPPKEVTEPDLTPDSNGDIVKAVTSMNKDFNKALNDLNIDINQSQANINTELDRLNKNVVNNSNATRDLAQTNIDIYNNTKQLIQGVEVAVKTGTASTVEAINTNGENTVNAVNTGFSDVGDSLEEIKGSLDGIANVDTSSAGTSGSCIEADTCTGFYTSGYPDGLSGVANAHFESIKTNVLDGFVNTFGNLDLSNAKRPSFTIPVLDFGDYSIEDYLNLDWIFGFVRFCLIFTAIATARKNILGG
ncbi:hypothetical protein AB4151_21605 [Vibrio splendidus]|uniref:Methyl-accepting chemotaxis protein n=1 Tax=Vibrio splendidus TaxID=29497 RepID=A0A2N7CJ33_VIBSP|nr:hypothetical protein [Vibrio splendidus]PMF30561.1 hypothetical protein BCV19_23580 [Vibrio splendidus]